MNQFGVECVFKGRVETNPSGHEKLIKFYYGLKGLKDQNVYVDFSECVWFDANLCALLDAILFKLKRDNGHSFYTDIDIIETRFEVLFRNGFFKSDKRLDDRKSTVGLTQFNPDDDQKFTNYIQSELLNHRALKNKSHLTPYLSDHFCEVFSNIQLHAQTTEPLFACGQYYPSAGVLKFTLVDMGVGYLIPIKRHTSNRIVTAKDAILWALSGNTTKQDAPGGIGLSAINTYCSENGGGFNIISGDHYWGNNLSPFDRREVLEFYGAIIHLIFKCK